MILKKLHLFQYKNHADYHLVFGNRINCIIGKNGTGKTNILDSIYHLAFTKSATSSSNSIVIMHEKTGFALHGTFNEFILSTKFEENKSKTIKIDTKECKPLDVIGKVPLVLVLPNDTRMIDEGSEQRRKFFDAALIQYDPEYLNTLLLFHKLLKQRNYHLKYSKGNPDMHLLQTYDEQIIPLCIIISDKRKEILKLLLPLLIKNYSILQSSDEDPSLLYQTQVTETFEVEYKNSIRQDIQSGRTSVGSHRDDFRFVLNKKSLKYYGSQGQQKTFIIALKFALYDLLNEFHQKKPMLLLDDIFDKLDEKRIVLLSKLLANDKRFGQVFVSDSRTHYIKEIFAKNEKVKFIEL